MFGSGDPQIADNLIEVTWNGIAFTHFDSSPDSPPVQHAKVLANKLTYKEPKTEWPMAILLQKGAAENFLAGNIICGGPGNPGDIVLDASTHDNVVLGPLKGLVVVDEGTNNQIGRK